MNKSFYLPDFPIITDDLIQTCRANNDYRPILFEWYKYVGYLCLSFAQIRPQSPALHHIPHVHFAIFTGLLNRCARLMHSNIALSHEGLFGETTAIIDRCIFESCVKIRWLCSTTEQDRFDRLISDGLKTDIKFKEEILKNITNREGKKLIIEERMLISIDSKISSAELSEEYIKTSKKLPTLEQMIGDDKLSYLVGQKIGSHHIHGTWASLQLHYLTSYDDEPFHPRDHDCETHVNQYLYISLAVLKAIKAFIEFTFLDTDEMKRFLELLSTIEEKISHINEEVVGNDFDYTPEKH